MVERIDPRQARVHLLSGLDTLLVCAYDSEEKFAAHRLEGALSLWDLQAKESEVPKDRELIFYCA